MIVYNLKIFCASITLFIIMFDILFTFFCFCNATMTHETNTRAHKKTQTEVETENVVESDLRWEPCLGPCTIPTASFHGYQSEEKFIAVAGIHYSREQMGIWR